MVSGGYQYIQNIYLYIFGRKRISFLKTVTMKSQIMISLYILVVILLPGSPSVYKAIVHSLGVLGALISMYWLNRYMNQIPVTLRTVKGSIIKGILFLMVLLNIKFLIMSLGLNLAHDHVQWLLNNYPTLSCTFINQRSINVALLVAILLLLSCQIYIILYPFEYHSINHKLASISCYLTVGVLVVTDFVLKAFLENVEPCKTYKVQSFAIMFSLSVEAQFGVRLSNGPIIVLLTILMLLLQLTERMVYYMKNRESQVAPISHPPPAQGSIPSIFTVQSGMENECQPNCENNQLPQNIFMRRKSTGNPCRLNTSKLKNSRPCSNLSVIEEEDWTPDQFPPSVPADLSENSSHDGHEVALTLSNGHACSTNSQSMDLIDFLNEDESDVPGRLCTRYQTLSAPPPPLSVYNPGPPAPPAPASNNSTSFTVLMFTSSIFLISVLAVLQNSILVEYAKLIGFLLEMVTYFSFEIVPVLWFWRNAQAFAMAQEEMSNWFNQYE